jgi:uncharacterized protein
MRRAEPVLICALSARSLAQSARAAGFAPVVLDAFADLDTRDAAAAWQRVPVDRRWRLRRRPLLAAAAKLAPPPTPLVWGSGFERLPGLLAELAADRELWGNDALRVRRVKDPLGFAAVAARLGITHPDISMRRPADSRGWLCKRAGAAGGGHVRTAAGRAPSGRGWYWQRRATGRPVSALILGAAGWEPVLGCSEQWCAPRPGRRFRFAGAAAPSRLSGLAREQLEAAATALSRHFGLIGLCSIDALVDGDTVTVLEVNPRPGAALDAAAGALGLNLFKAHVAACRCNVGIPPPPPVGTAGSLIVYAERPTVVPVGFEWPAWAADRSPPGTRIARHGPICTVLARGRDIAAVRDLLAGRAGDIRSRLDDTGFSVARLPIPGPEACWPAEQR